jgi:hypothetical protein
MPPNESGPFDRDPMARRVRAATAGVAVAATAATVALTFVAAGTQADAESPSTPSTFGSSTIAIPDEADLDAGATIDPAPNAGAPGQLSTAPAPTPARGRSHAGSGGS